MGYEYIAALPSGMQGSVEQIVGELLGQFPLSAEYQAGQAVAAFQWSAVPGGTNGWPFLSLHFAPREVLAIFHGGPGARGFEVLHALTAIVSAQVDEPVVFEEA